MDGVYLCIWWVDVSQLLVGVPVVLKAPANINIVEFF